MYPSRAWAACESAAGQVAHRRRDRDEAIRHMRTSINTFPHSAAYIDLALELWIRGGEDPASTDGREARRLLRHADTLRPQGAPARPLDEAFAVVGESRGG
jgi:hypothetical protein